MSTAQTTVKVGSENRKGIYAWKKVAGVWRKGKLFRKKALMWVNTMITNLVINGDFSKGWDSWINYSSAANDGKVRPGLDTANFKIVDSCVQVIAGYGKYYIPVLGEQIHQKITVKPNTTYELSAKCFRPLGAKITAGHIFMYYEGMPDWQEAILLNIPVNSINSIEYTTGPNTNWLNIVILAQRAEEERIGTVCFDDIVLREIK